MSDVLRLLILEDQETDAELMERALRAEGLAFTATRVFTERDFVDAVDQMPPDVILADYTLPSYDGLAALQYVAQHHPDIPFIFVSGSLGEETAIDALHFGATDYVLKHRLSRLGPSVRRALLEVQSRRRRDEAEEDVRRISREWEEIFQAIGHPTVIMDADHNLLAANDAAIHATGMSLDELRGTRCYRVFHGECVTVPAPGCPMERMRVTGRVETAEMEVEALGGTYWVSCTPLADEGGRLQKVIHIATDITERKRAEHALRESEEKFKGIFDHVTDGILLVVPDSGAFVMANRTMTAMLGCTDEELVQLGVQDIHADHDLLAIEAVLRRNVIGESIVVHDLMVMRKDGTSFVADVNSAPVTILGRQLVLMNVRDVTERRALQASVAQSDRLASMGMLAAGVAHEINNPLSYVLYNVETLVEELARLDPGVPGRDDLLRAARETLEGTLRIKDIARGLSAFSRVDKDEATRVDLRYVIECAASMAQNEIKYRAKLIKRLDPVPPVWATEGRLSQVVLNLLINAAHAIPEGYPDRNTITVRTFAEGDDVIVQVTDTGGGITTDHLARIFEPFFTTKAAGIGSGLGLAISRDIVRGFSGDISAESEPGHGARFTVRVPAAGDRSEAHARGGTPRSSVESSVRGRVLIVDDEEAMVRMLQRMLSRYHEVVTASSGIEGRAILEGDEAFDLILCDLMMPEMTGMDLHRWLVERNFALAEQVVFLTGGAFTPRASDYLANVTNLRFEKPLNTAELQRIVMERVRESRQQRAPHTQEPS
jgi:PAS domain S-box-containing protein